MTAIPIWPSLFPTEYFSYTMMARNSAMSLRLRRSMSAAIQSESPSWITITMAILIFTSLVLRLSTFVMAIWLSPASQKEIFFGATMAMAPLLTLLKPPAYLG